MSTTLQDNIVAPANGLLIYNTNNKRFSFYNGTSWQELAGNIYSRNGTVSGNRTVTLDSARLQFAAFGRRNALEIRRIDQEDIGLSFRNSGGLLTAGIASSSITSNNVDGLDFFTIGKDSDPNNIGISMRLKNTGKVVFPDYGMGNNSGTPARLLAVENDGEMIEMAIGDIFNDGIRAIHDTDNDTKIFVEKFADEDIIRFNIEGQEELILDKNLSGDGRLSLNTNRTNILIGKETGETIGSNSVGNVFMGNFVGRQTIVGSDNVYIGNEAARYQEGSKNVMIGRQAGYNSTTGDGNVFIGYHAGLHSNGNNKLYIHNNSDNVTPLIYGEFDNRVLRVNGTLKIKGEYSFPTTDGNLGDWLITDGSGYLTWTNVLSQANITANTLVADTLTLAADSAALGMVLTSDSDGNATWQDNNKRVAHAHETNEQTIFGTHTGWVNTQHFTNSMSVDSGDLVVVHATFAAKLDGGSGTDRVRFRLAMGNGVTIIYGGETALLDGFENTRNKFVQVPVQYTFTAISSDNYVFRLSVNMLDTDDDLILDNVNISAIKF
jgi:hypothetical protein